VSCVSFTILPVVHLYTSDCKCIEKIPGSHFMKDFLVLFFAFLMMS
jgi:hypothetical protein